MRAEPTIFRSSIVRWNIFIVSSDFFHVLQAPCLVYTYFSSSSTLHATVKGFCLSDYSPLTTDFKIDYQVDLTKSFVPLHLSLEVRHRKSEIQSQTDIILLPRNKQTLVRNFRWPPGVKSHSLSTGSKKMGASPTTEFCQQL